MLETICDIMVDAYKRNWITSRDGNVSIRHHDREAAGVIRGHVAQAVRRVRRAGDRGAIEPPLQRGRGQSGCSRRERGGVARAGDSVFE